MSVIPTQPLILASIRLNLRAVDQEADTLIHQHLMQPQQAAMRIAYNRLLEGVKHRDIWRTLRDLFPYLTGRNLNDAITLASGTLESQQELLPDRLAQLDKRLTKAQNNLEQALSRPSGSRPERVRAIRLLIQRLTDQRAELQSHLEKGTVRPAVFGQRKTWHQLPGSLAEWRHRRARQFFSRGACNKLGNPHCRLMVAQGGDLHLSVRIPTELKQRGDQVTTEAIWLTFAVDYSRQYEPTLRQLALAGATKQASYEVRLMRLAPRQYRAYVTIDEPVKQPEYGIADPLPASITLIGGLDLNLDHLAVVITDRQGQYRQHKVFKYPNLGEMPKEKSKWLIGNLAQEVIAWLKAQGGQALVIEDLDISNQGNGSAAFNRRTIPFAHRQLAETLSRRALRAGLAVKRVNPAYTSWIGQLKYAPQYGINRHVAAAYVIGRRGMGLQERLPKHLIVKFPYLASLIRADILHLKTKLARSHEGEDKKLVKQINTRREWVRRLENHQVYLPEKGKPWLLWVTLYLAAQTISGVRAGLCGEVPMEGTTPSVGPVAGITSHPALHLQKGLPLGDVGIAVRA
jgi:IS605 OrfB family transposase